MLAAPQKKQKSLDEGHPMDSSENKPRTSFQVMSEEELLQLVVPYSNSESFALDVNKVLKEKGTAVVTGILSESDCAKFGELKQRELASESPQGGYMVHAHSEIVWKARLHPKVRGTFARIYGTAELSVGMDMTSIFYTPVGTPATLENEQWLHVDQNTNIDVHICIQGMLYIQASSDEASSTTVVWPESHLDSVHGRLMSDLDAVELAHWKDDCGIPAGQYVSLNNLKNSETKAQLLSESTVKAKRVPMPAGALLLWDSRTVHQGWYSGPRLAVPVCWEPRERVSRSATARKLFMAAIGVASSHSPSEGRVHPAVSTKYGARLRWPAVRPYAVLPEEELAKADWEKLWEKWCEDEFVEDVVVLADAIALASVLRPEVAFAL